MNLFWSTRALTDAREDHLTEFVAAAIEYCPLFRSAFAKLVLSEFAGARNWVTPAIEGVKTQVSFPGTTCCPDMVLTLEDGHIVICEHKLDALETTGPERDPRPQLERYLDLQIDGLVYVRSSWSLPTKSVVEHEKYVRPPGYSHFLWRDFYPLLGGGEHVLLDWLRDGFERLGFTPPHPVVGEMDGTDDAENESNRRNFAKLWGPLRTEAGRLGWRVGSGSIVELYLSDNPTSAASSVFISPTKAARFLVRITPHAGKEAEVEQRLEEIAATNPTRTEVAVAVVPRKDGKASVINVVSTLREILGEEVTGTQAMEEKLLKFVAPLLYALQTNHAGTQQGAAADTPSATRPGCG